MVIFLKDSIAFLDNLLKKDDVVVVGCSGGPDSMVLLTLLLKLRNKKNLKIICCHVNHNVRNESIVEMNYVEKFSASNNIIFEKMIITNYGDDNFENEARNFRYNFFDEIVNKYNASYLMTAHHGDDLIETILMRIVRGSTLSGYKGFSMIVNKNNYKIVRPLIFATKDEIVNYANDNNIQYFIDSTNMMDIHTRNRYRKVVLPFLKSEDKNVNKKFLKFNNIMEKCETFINNEVNKYIDDIFIDDRLVISKFLELDDFVKNRVICYMLEKFYQDDLFLISDSHVDLIINLINSKKSNGSIYLPNEVKAIKNYDYLEIKKDIASISSYDIEIENFVLLPNGKKIEKIDFSELNNNNFCRLSSEDVCLPLHVRTRKNGDKMKIKNSIGYRKIKDIFIDLKIPVEDRDTWPIVVDSKDNIVWLPGLKKSCFDRLKSDKCDIILKYY